MREVFATGIRGGWSLELGGPDVMGRERPRQEGRGEDGHRAEGRGERNILGEADVIGDIDEVALPLRAQPCVG